MKSCRPVATSPSEVRIAPQPDVQAFGYGADGLTATRWRFNAG
ncbi:hypothetical protein ACFY1S_06590 [Micromonospora sp. NPDC000663]